MAEVFVSYSHQDQTAVNRAMQRVVDAGHNVWADVIGIRPGDNWREEIVSAIEAADIVLIFVSATSIYSDNVRKELDLAEQANKRIVPVYVEHTPVPPLVKWQLAGLQSIDLVTDPEHGISALIDSLENVEITDPYAPKQMNVEISPFEDGISYWRGHQIAVRSERQLKYLGWACDSFLFVDGELVAEGGGFTWDDRLEGTFLHRGEPYMIRCHITAAGSRSDRCSRATVEINGRVIDSFDVAIRNQRYGYAGMLLVFFIAAAVVACFIHNFISALF